MNDSAETRCVLEKCYTGDSDSRSCCPTILSPVCDAERGWALSWCLVPCF